MFTYVNVKNFKSLKDVYLNLNETKNRVKDFVAIYGENGSGKTNIVELFNFLQLLLMARSTDTIINKIPREFWKMQEEMKDHLPTEILELFNFSLDLGEYRTIEEDGDTIIQYGFRINNKEGFYYIRFNKFILEEKLYYVSGKQRTYLFEIRKEDSIFKSFNNNTFVNAKYRDLLNEEIDKYWGRYSFLSILVYEMLEKNREYISNMLSDNIIQVIEWFLSLKINVDKGITKVVSNNFIKRERLVDIQKGIIKKDKIKDIKMYEKVLNIFFTQAYADIKNVYYIFNEKEDTIEYELYFNKILGDSIKTIPARLESDGTRRVLNQFDTLIGAVLGDTVIIDEIDNGIHDVLMKNIIMSIMSEITGQLIITTHNTYLLEILPKECIYILSTDYKGNKSINSINEYGIRIQKNNNIRDLYLKGVFGGIPTTSYINFEEIKNLLEDNEGLNEEDS